jgi:ABC-type sugar transport system ATPase subunit
MVASYDCDVDSPICEKRIGLVQQVGDPLALYNQPANRFVAGFRRRGVSHDSLARLTSAGIQKRHLD